MKKPNQELNNLNQFLKKKPSTPPLNSSSQTTPHLSNTPKLPSFPFLRRIQPLISSKLLQLQTYLKVSRNQHLIALSIFTVVATYVCYKMQSSFDRIRERVKYSKSLKEQQIEREKDYLNKMLGKSEFEAVPIGKEYQAKINYKFEEKEISTKDTLMEIMKEDLARGLEVPEQYKKEFYQAYPELQK